jgi:hypothetical protein
MVALPSTPLADGHCDHGFEKLTPTGLPAEYGGDLGRVVARVQRCRACTTATFGFRKEFITR